MIGARLPRPPLEAARAAALPLLLAAWICGCGPPVRPNILLVVIDTARADRFSFDGYARDTSPEIAAAGREGAVYERAYTPAPWTVPAHASLFTGLFPSSHGADSGHLRLDDERLTLAEVLRSAGYRTVAYTENPWVGKDYNFDQGFDTFEEIWRKVPGEGGDKGAGLTNVRIDQWLTWREGNPDARQQPFFLFVNYLETHLPYNPPEPERFRFLSPPIDMQRVGRMSRFKHPEEMKFILGVSSLDPADLRLLSDLYDGAIAYADRRTGEVIEMLRRRSLLDGTVVVVTSDHGELLGEHRLLDHKMNVFEQVLRIPMVLRYPAAVKPGQRIREPVLLQDLYPTLLGLAAAGPAPSGGSGAPAGPGPAAGREAVPLPGVAGLGGDRARGGAAADPRRPEPLIAEFARPVSFLDVMREAAPGRDLSAWDRALVSYRVGDEKLHWSSDGRHHLYDLAADPSEDHDLGAERPERVRALAAEVEAWLSRPGARPPLGIHP
jgi:arylsulfatase A-like enzyme